MWKCTECKKEIDSNLIRKRVRCPYCGSKILTKVNIQPKRIKTI